MGRQINFYFDSNDEKDFLKLIYDNDIVFLRRRYKREKVETYNEFHINPAEDLTISQTYICYQTNINDVSFLSDKENSIVIIDSLYSPVIEFDRSRFDSKSNLLVSGRLWYEHKYWTKDEQGNSILKEKSKELERLYNSLARWIRKHCTRLDNGNYIAPHAMELYKNGAQISP